jgi:hypothetical protein
VGSATGSDAAAAAVASLIGPGTRLLAHPHRVSFALVGDGALGTAAARARLAERLAADVSLHDQQGCLSPVGVVVEGRSTTAAAFAEDLAEALAACERLRPRAALGPGAALAVRAFHDDLALRQAEGGARVLAGERLAWVVASLEHGSLPTSAPLHRCVWVRAVEGPGEPGRLLARWRGKTASLGVAGDAGLRRRGRSLAASLGATRVVPVGRMQSPPLSWRQDGAHPVLDLLPRRAELGT